MAGHESGSLLGILLGQLDVAAAAGAVTDEDLFGAYIKQIVTNSEAILAAIGGGTCTAATIDLDQVAASYDLFTGTTEVVLLESLVIRMPAEACGGALTSISIQTDDATPQEIINSTDGAVANLTSEAQLAWTGAVYIAVGSKIQLTIGGGAHGSEYLCDVVAAYRAVVGGGELA